MKNFSRVLLAIVIGAAIIGGTVYLRGQKEKPVIEPNLSLAPVGKTCAAVPGLSDQSLKLVTKVIDGDTFLIEGGYSVRVLGIDADERGYPCYEPAKSRLEELILDKEVRLEAGPEDKDQYCRYLRYAVFPASAEASAGKDDQNISLELVKQGLAVARFSPTDIKYREDISRAETEARENQVGCQWSSFARAAENESSDAKTELSWEKLMPELTGLKIVDACQASNYYGKEMIVEGKVADGFRSKTNTVFLNFEKPYPNQCFSGVIFSSDQYKFVGSPEKYYANQTVRIKGEVKEYQGKPEIILTDPLQIETGK